jgi:hypothetical protein
MGCKNRLYSGLNWVFEQCHEAIILEDDCIPSPSFFDFCNALLDRYRDDGRIMGISGTSSQPPLHQGRASYYFSRYTHTWGWATWRRAWRQIDIDLKSWPQALRERWLPRILEDAAEASFWSDMFSDMHRGLIDTWDFQWLYTCWCHGGLTAVPNQNLVTNIGVGSDATHTKHDNGLLFSPAGRIDKLVHPDFVAADRETDRLFFENCVRTPGQKWWSVLKSKVALRTRLRKALGRPEMCRSSL